MQEKMLTNSHINIKIFSFKLIENGEYVVNLQCMNMNKMFGMKKKPLSHKLLVSLLIENEEYTGNKHWTSILVNGLNALYTGYIYIDNNLSYEVYWLN